MKNDIEYNSSERRIKYQYIVDESEKTKRLGRFVILIGILLMLIALHSDIKILFYPSIIYKTRIATIIIYCAYVLFTYTTYAESPRRVIRYYSYCLVIGMIFAVFFNIILFQTHEGIFDYRGPQLLLSFSVFIMVFSMGAKDMAIKIVLYPIGFMVAYFVMFKDMSMFEWTKYFNAFVTILMVCFYHRLCSQKDFAEFRLRKISQINVSKLKREIEDRKDQEKSLKVKANLDELTGLLSRRSGLEELEKLFKLATEENKPLSLCYIDLDRLKYINDTYGHVEGDRFIKIAVEIIQSQLRDGDLFARLGGDEFIIGLYNTTPNIAEKIWARISDGFDHFNSQHILIYKINASHGIAGLHQNNYSSLNDLIEGADEKMYGEKKRKRVFMK
ncbi:GGDEF domain-containing protein [Alkaliphilus peptidifermentans]|uniref:Diguanylate cyclase (GGDEF) domain-containing protein n=1 Tax=Alkaliphilus peptidifermentans DSM 18978 TaxID=1120976 RepID=A0A1G5AE41_9FIRM|nr:GGDEF domain-containing protein [Alkaliphilus peptidifermentans]SCX76148.1 diguanylate cyclase (GGDEF) domain-containing protein [Alkaliphilus peptidifermentans DSM 18978]